MAATARGRGVVVAHVPDPEDHASVHERITLLDFARRLAVLRDEDMAGLYEPGRSYPGPLYFVPSSTLTSEQAATLGIRGPRDLFGGVVPQALVGTKAISHPLVASDAASVPGWCHAFADHAGDAVLAGHTAFDPGDALRAGERLLARGPVRLKPVRASGGRGQVPVRNRTELHAALAEVDEEELRTHGLVLEEDLQEVRTFSVGQVEVADLGASYYGFQRLTRSNDGEEVFGGSDLVLVRGGFDALLATALPGEIRQAVEQARRYDAAVQACFPGFYASRRNYDVALGRDARGQPRSGVLEQSWRVGGATGPEVAGLEVFRREPQRQQVHASGFEVFGDSPEPPRHASVHFRGVDPQMGRLTKFTVVQADDDAR